MTVASGIRGILVFALTLAACGARTGAANESEQSTVRVSAEGRVEVAPDIVTLNVRVVTEDRRSAVAAEENASVTKAVITALRRVAGALYFLKSPTSSDFTPRW